MPITRSERAATGAATSQIDETPRKYYDVHGPGTHQQGLVGQRKMAREAAANHLISCTVDDWFAEYAKHQGIIKLNGNQLSKVEWDRLVERVYETLARDNLVDSNGWKTIRELVSAGADEDSTFRGIRDIAEAVHTTAKSFNSQLSRTTVVECSPRESTASEVFGSSNKPDARGTLVFPDRPTFSAQPRRSTRVANKNTVHYRDEGLLLSPNTVDTVMAAEFKLEDKPEICEQNENQILGGASHILYNDPRRRYSYGLTIENATMRFWHFSRSHIAMAVGFDYHTQPKDFIRFLLFITFASPTALGFDPTITRILDEDRNIAYLYTVGNDTYQTIGNPLSEERCLPIVSRATRVWTVRKIVGVDEKGRRLLDSKVHVLKDVWLFEDAPGEKAIQDEIFAKLRQSDDTNGDALVAEAKKYFMTILEDERVRSGNTDDVTPGPAIAWKPANLTIGPEKTAVPPQAKGAQRVLEKNGSRNTLKTAPTLLTSKHVPRVHRRTVFEERCETLYELHDTRDFISCLQDIVQGLKYMRAAGFVHRDISPGNCFWYRTGTQGKISDLEYAKLYDQTARHDPRTGTPEFMAIETQAKFHVFLSRQNIEDEDADDNVGPTWFTFNFFHDIESVYWMFIWYLIHRVPRRLRTYPGFLDSLKTVKQHGAELFSGGLKGNTTRHSFIASGRPRPVRGFLKSLYEPCLFLLDGLGLVTKLERAYTRLEATKPVLNSNGSNRWGMEHFTDELYDDFDKMFISLRVALDVSGQAKFAAVRSVNKILAPSPPASPTRCKRPATAHPDVVLPPLKKPRLANTSQDDSDSSMDEGDIVKTS